MRLETEGLVELEQNKGFRVSAVSQEQLTDVMRVRVEIESLALRWSIEQGDVNWEANLLGAFHRLSRQTKMSVDGATIDPVWASEHRAFHAALVAACGSPTLMSMRDGLFDQAQRYVALSVAARAIRRDDIAEHEQIMQAALNRDASRAVDLIGEHIDSTTKKVLKSLAQQGHAPRLVSVGKVTR
jgi:DNA-binding GntR family transcriptional regulator